MAQTQSDPWLAAEAGSSGVCRNRSRGPELQGGHKVASLYRLQERVATMMECGASLDRVETEVIEPSDLASDRKAALWLYAWSFTEGREQRAHGVRHLAATGD